MKRRELIKAGSIAAGISIVPRYVLGRGYIPPSDKLNMAGIGVGGQGGAGGKGGKGADALHVNGTIIGPLFFKNPGDGGVGQSGACSRSAAPTRKSACSSRNAPGAACVR